MKVSEARARDHGEVLTPQWMVRAMTAPLAEEIAVAERILDLCSGPGAFLSELLAKRLSALTSDHEATLLRAVSGLYGFELLQDNVESSRLRLIEQVRRHMHAGGYPLARQSEVLKLAAAILNQNIMQADVLAQRPEELQLPVWSADGTSFTSIALIPGTFDIIVSNPPYQKNISGSELRNRSKATPIYNLFYDWARSLEPQHMCFIMPAKWYTGGWGLDRWRVSVLADRHIRVLHDYRDSRAIFENTEVNGGICWVLWSKAYVGDAHVVRHDRLGNLISSNVRPLLEPGSDFFVRNEAALSILRKVNSFELAPGKRFSDLVLSTTPFGIPSNFKDYATEPSTARDVSLYYIKEKEYWISPDQISSNRKVLDEWKVFFPLCHNQHSAQIIGKPKAAAPREACTHSYVVAAGFADEAQVVNAISYMKTRFFRFLAAQLKISPIATRQVYRLIPAQDWSKPWTDAQLYAKYGFTTEEIAHIEGTISAMA